MVSELPRRDRIYQLHHLRKPSSLRIPGKQDIRRIVSEINFVYPNTRDFYLASSNGDERKLQELAYKPSFLVQFQ